jgi:hypothetical protein
MLKRVALWRRGSLGVCLLAAVLVTPLGSQVGPGEPEEEEVIGYMQNCGCIREDPQTKKCAEWGRSGCPRAKVNTCGVPCQ